jgi:NADH-quinone oxidoreductase subunit N
VNLYELVEQLKADTLGTTDSPGSLELFAPELVLCATIVVMLLVRLFHSDQPRGAFAGMPWSWPFRWLGQTDPAIYAFIGSVIALMAAIPNDGLTSLSTQPPQEIFTGMLVYDTVTVYLRVFLIFFALLFIILTRMTGLADRADGQDVYTLMLGATLGMCIMASANHLMTVFLGVEMASVPSYVLAGALKGRQRAGEAALKYAVYGAGAAGVMLYGISLLGGVLGTAHLPSIATELASLDFAAEDAGGRNLVLALAGLMIMVGLAFKLSAVPFHFWCPDVFEGATAEVNAFLSVASKAAALALLVRVALGVSVPPAGDQATALQAAPSRTVLVAMQNQQTDEAAAAASQSPVRTYVVGLIAMLAAITCTFGNLAAYGQSNIKRLLAYSTIAHAGYMMMPVAAAVQLAGTNLVEARQAVSALLFYAGVYLFMNLGAFAIVAFLRNTMHSEEIADYGGLIRSAPMTAIALTAILFSLIGLPPLGGFWAKVKAFMALVDAGGPVMLALFVIGGLNTVVSLVYYLRVAKTMCMDPEPETRGPVTVPFLPAVYIFAVALPVILLGVMPERLARWAELAGMQLFM